MTEEGKQTPLIQEPLYLACIALFFNTLSPPPFVANKEAHSKLRCKLSIAKFPISKYVNHVLQLTHSIYVDYITLSYPYCDCFTSFDAVKDTIYI